jgi:hypothetical protein
MQRAGRHRLDPQVPAKLSPFRQAQPPHHAPRRGSECPLLDVGGLSTVLSHEPRARRIPHRQEGSE